MANTKQFTNLPAVTTLADTDIIPVQTADGATSKITKADLKTTLGDQGITAIVEDTAPTLGGQLNMNGNTITGDVITDGGFTGSSETETILGNNGGAQTTIIGASLILEVGNGQDLTVNTNDLTGGQTASFPDKTGTLAMTDDIPDVSEFITLAEVPSDLSTYDNSVSQFITSGDVPASIAEVVEDTSPQLGGDLDGQSTYKIENITSVNGIEMTAGTGGLTISGGDVELTAGGTGTITIPDMTGTMVVTDDANGVTTINSQVNITGDNLLSLDGGVDFSTGSTTTNGQFTVTDNATGNKELILDITGLTDSTPRSIAFPDGDGTIALTTDIPDVSSFITDISGQDLSTADNTTSAFITVGDIPTIPADISELTDTTNLLTTSETVISPQPGTDGYSGRTITLEASEDFTRGQLGYIDSNGTVTLADASALATSGAMVMALEAIDQSENGVGKFLLDGVIDFNTLDPQWTKGAIIYLSETAGGMTETKPTTANSVTQVLGVALDENVLLFKPELVMVEHA